MLFKIGTVSWRYAKAIEENESRKAMNQKERKNNQTTGKTPLNLFSFYAETEL